MRCVQVNCKNHFPGSLGRLCAGSPGPRRPSSAARTAGARDVGPGVRRGPHLSPAPIPSPLPLPAQALPLPRPRTFWGGGSHGGPAAGSLLQRRPSRTGVCEQSCLGPGRTVLRRRAGGAGRPRPVGPRVHAAAGCASLSVQTVGHVLSVKMGFLFCPNATLVVLGGKP